MTGLNYVIHENICGNPVKFHRIKVLSLCELDTGDGHYLDIEGRVTIDDQLVWSDTVFTY